MTSRRRRRWPAIRARRTGPRARRGLCKLPFTALSRYFVQAPPERSGAAFTAAEKQELRTGRRPRSSLWRTSLRRPNVAAVSVFASCVAHSYSGCCQKRYSLQRRAPTGRRATKQTRLCPKIIAKHARRAPSHPQLPQQSRSRHADAHERRRADGRQSSQVRPGRARRGGQTSGSGGAVGPARQRRAAGHAQAGLLGGCSSGCFRCLCYVKWSGSSTSHDRSRAGDGRASQYLLYTYFERQ